MDATVVVAFVGAIGMAVSSILSYKAGASRIQFEVELLNKEVKELQEKVRHLREENHSADIAFAEIKKDLEQIKAKLKISEP